MVVVVVVVVVVAVVVVVVVVMVVLLLLLLLLRPEANRTRSDTTPAPKRYNRDALHSKRNETNGAS